MGTVCGAKAIPSDAQLRPLLSIPTIRLWPDNDDEGRQHMERIGARLIALGHRDVKIAEWADAPAKGDAADLHNAAHARQIVDRAKPYGPPEQTADRAGTRLRFYTAKEIAAATSIEPPWRAKPYLVDGGITELDGRAKAAGKTTFATYLSRAALDGTDFLGEPTMQTPAIVYLTEQTPATFREVLRRADLLDRENFYVLHWHDTIGVAWPAIVAAAMGKARETGAKVLVVDTAPQFAGLKGDAENKAGAALVVMRPLQEAAAAGLAVLMLHHERKGGGEVGESGRGSSAFAGAVDIVLSLRRGDGNTRPTVRQLHALSRFDETPDLLVIELTDDGYVALRTDTEVAKVEALRQEFDATPTNEGAALREDDLLKAADVKRTLGQAAIQEHLKNKHLLRIGGGKRGDPYRHRTRRTKSLLSQLKEKKRQKANRMGWRPDQPALRRFMPPQPLP